MAFEGMSFNLFNDSALTQPFNGTLSIVNESNLSDNPQTFTKYLGSLTTANKLEAVSAPGIDYITLTPVDTLPNWTAATSYIVGDRVGAVADTGFVYKCTTAGTSHATTEPTWPTGGIGSTVVDNTVVWTKIAMRHPTTEVKLAITEGGLTGATAGAALNVSLSIVGGVATAVPIWIKVTNVVTTVSNNTGHPEVKLNINSVIETAI